MYQIAQSRYLQNRFHYFIFPEHYQFKQAENADYDFECDPYYVWKLSKLLEKTKKKCEEDSLFKELVDAFYSVSSDNTYENLNEIGVNIMVSYKEGDFKTLLCHRIDDEYDIDELLAESDIDVNLISNEICHIESTIHITPLESLILQDSKYIKENIVKLVRHGAVMAVCSLPRVGDPQIDEFVELCAKRFEH